MAQKLQLPKPFVLTEFVSPQNSYIEYIISNMILGGGAFER